MKEVVYIGNYYNKEWYDLYNNKCGVYKITCMVNNKIYIGSSKNIYQRWKDHNNDLINKRHINSHLQKDWNKYGKDNFKFEIVEFCNEEDVRNREQFYIDSTNCCDRNIGYNINPTVDNTIVSEETKTKISNSVKQLGAYGEKCYFSKYSEKDVKKAIQMLLDNELWSNITKETGLPKATISGIVQKNNWAYLTEGIEFPNFKEHKHSKLNEKEVKEIIKELSRGGDNISLADKYGVAPKTISDIRLHKTWVYLTKDITFPSTPDNLRRGEQNNKSLLNEKQVREIKQLISENNMSLTAIGRQYNVGVNAILSIKNNKTWKHVN